MNEKQEKDDIKGLKTFAEQKNTKAMEQKQVQSDGSMSAPKTPRSNNFVRRRRKPGNGAAKPIATEETQTEDAGTEVKIETLASHAAKVASKKAAENAAKVLASGATKSQVATAATAQGQGVAKPKQSNRDSGPKLKIIPLGGMQEIGKNLTIFEYGNDMIAVDCGMTFPNDEMLGIDLVIPDTTYLKKNINKMRGFVITHGHEDHIGALPYVLRDINAQIYCTALAGGIIKNKLEEHKNLAKVKMNIKKAGDRFKLGCFEIEMIHVNHSIADAVALHIKTPVGSCIFMGDFKIDTTPVAGDMINLARFGEIGKEGTLLLISDSTNAERPGVCMSEKTVGVALDSQFKNCDKRIIVASFSSNIHRIQQICDISHKYGRKVVFSGRSMENMVKVATELEYLKVAPGQIVDINTLKKYPKEKMTIVTTGSQGEPMSALMRMSMGSHKQIHISPEDKILMSAHPIPGNEKSIYSLINELTKRGAEVVYDKAAGIHVSGHACGEELKMILALTKPKFFMPGHGEYRHLVAHANLAKQVGVDPKNIFISENGKVLELSAKGARMNGTVTAGKVLVDGLGVGDVGQTVLRDRMHLSQDGVIIVVATFDAGNAVVIAGPDIISRGITLTKDTEDISEAIRTIAADAIESCLERGLNDWATIKSELRAKISDFVYRKTKRNPMILPINMEV